MEAMRDARELHADLKRTASLEAMHQQQVEAEEQQSVLEETDDDLGASLSSAVKLHLGFGKKGSKGGTLSAATQEAYTSAKQPNHVMHASSCRHLLSLPPQEAVADRCTLFFIFHVADIDCILTSDCYIHICRVTCILPVRVGCCEPPATVQSLPQLLPKQSGT